MRAQRLLETALAACHPSACGLTRRRAMTEVNPHATPIFAADGPRRIQVRHSGDDDLDEVG